MCQRYSTVSHRLRNSDCLSQHPDSTASDLVAPVTHSTSEVRNTLAAPVRVDRVLGFEHLRRAAPLACKWLAYLCGHDPFSGGLEQHVFNQQPDLSAMQQGALIRSRPAGTGMVAAGVVIVIVGIAIIVIAAWRRSAMRYQQEVTDAVFGFPTFSELSSMNVASLFQYAGIGVVVFGLLVLVLGVAVRALRPSE